MTENLNKPVLSPRDISLICGIPQEQVGGWMESGKLKSFMLPGGHARVLRTALIEYLQAENHGVPACFGGPDDLFHVLMVEDDHDLIEIIAELLKDEPRISVRTAENGFTAGLQIASWHPDLILLDFLMPGMSGFEVCRKIRENPDTRDIPVCALTSLTADESRRAVMESGVSDFLGKPFRSEDLLNKVRHLLGLGVACGEPPAGTPPSSQEFPAK